MRTIVPSATFSLASVKPLEDVDAYRARCVSAVKQALSAGPRRRRVSPVSGKPLEPSGSVEGLAYGRCPDGGGLFLVEVPSPEAWAAVLAGISQYRHSPQAFHAELAQSRTDHVYAPKLEWMETTLRLHELAQPRLLEVATPPNPLTALLRDSGLFSEIEAAEESALARGQGDGGPVGAAVLLESLDRVDAPEALLRQVHARLLPGGLLFVTALVSSGFDFAALGLSNAYLYPPDRANCFTVQGLDRLLQQTGFTPVEISTPGVLDVEIVQAHRRRRPALALSSFERHVLEADAATQAAFQTFLQEHRLSSFARVVARKQP